LGRDILVVQAARSYGVTVSFWDYAKVGVPLTALSDRRRLAAGVWMIWNVNFVFRTILRNDS
jgi:Na+/H+ antiporter NhaD/arsenite permease-like protein